MRLVSIRHDGCYLGFKYIGTSRRYHKGTLTIIGDKGTLTAVHGFINNKGEFTPYCTKDKCNKCKSFGKGECRYSHVLHEGEGYYINEEDLTWL